MTEAPLLEVTLDGRRWALDPRGAAVLPDQETGFVADLHLGKTTHFRRRGLAVPEGGEDRDLSRLAEVVGSHALRRLVVLGDLVHTSFGLTPDVVGRFASWRAAHPDLELVLVRGNHDRGAGPLPADWGIRAVEGPVAVAGVECRHEPPPPRHGSPAPSAVLAGHLHPVVRIREGKGRALRPRCFWWRPPVLVLPAFGAFTGGHLVRPSSGDRVFAVPPEHEGVAVVEVGG